MTTCLFAQGSFVAAALLAATSQAGDLAQRLSLNGEAGAGTVLSEYQRDTLDYGIAVQGSVRPGLLVRKPLVVQMALSGWWLPSDSGYGRVTLLGGGLRFEPRVASVARLVADAHVGAGLTGVTRFMFDLGTGVELDLSPTVALGPVLRYAQVLTVDGDVGSDPKLWSIGASVTLRAPPPPPGPPPAPPRPSAGTSPPPSAAMRLMRRSEPAALPMPRRPSTARHPTASISGTLQDISINR